MSDSLEQINQKMIVRDSFLEYECPYQKLIEFHSVMIINIGREGQKIKKDVLDKLWSSVYQYLYKINDHYTTPFLN